MGFGGGTECVYGECPRLSSGEKCEWREEIERGTICLRYRDGCEEVSSDLRHYLFLYVCTCTLNLSHLTT